MTIPKYPGTAEVAPGVFIDFGEDPAIYIADDEGEIVTWNYDEIKQDPSGWTASMMAMLNVGREGTDAIRELLGKPKTKKRSAGYTIIDGLAQHGIVRSMGRRMVSQGGVKVNGKVVDDISHPLHLGDLVIVGRGNRFTVTKEGKE